MRSHTDSMKMAPAWPGLVFLLVALLTQGGFGQTTNLTSYTTMPTVSVTDKMLTLPTVSGNLRSNSTLCPAVGDLTLQNEGSTTNLTVSFTIATGDVTHYTVELVDTRNASVVQTHNNISRNNTLHTFSGLVPGRRYQVNVTTVGASCNSTQVTGEACTLPERVQVVTLENKGSTTSLTVNFTMATGDVTHYVVELVDTTNQSVVHTEPLPNVTTWHNFSGLVPGRRYQVKVTTVSGDCNSTQATDEACTVPEIVQNVTLDNKGTTTNLTVNFTMATGDVTHYVAELVDTTNASVVKTQNIPSNITWHTFPSLIPGRRYEVTVTTFGGDCNSTTATYSSRTVPETVEDLTLENNGTTDSLTVRFTMAIGDVTRYAVELVNMTNQYVVLTKNLSNNTNVHTFTELDPCRVYQVTVTTCSEELNSTSATETACTDPTAVEALVLDNGNTTDRLTVTFRPSSCKNAAYAIELKDASNGSLVQNETVVNTSHTFKGLKSGRLYKVTVRTIGGECKGIQKDVEMCTDPQVVKSLKLDNRGSSENLTVSFTGAGDYVDNYTVILTNSTSEVSREVIYPNQIEWSFVKLTSCTKYKVSVTTSSSWCHNTVESGEELTYPNKVSGDVKVKNENHLKIEWDEPQGNVEFINVSLSKGQWRQWERNFSSSKHSHVTDALEHSTTYNVSVEACCQHFCSPEVFEITTTPPIILIACLTSVITVLIGAAVTGVLYYKRRRDGKSPPLTSITLERKRKPIQFSSFPEHYQRLDADSGFLFSEEYQELSTVGKDQAMEAATLPENRTKNRYTNILPYDVSRVKLASIEDIPHSDYINANYIRGHSSAREYIAAQGPLAGTREDFWRMVWEQKVNQIVMLTNCVERGQPKCECYWPMDITPVRYGDISLVMKWDKPDPEWTIRNLLLKHQKTGEERPLHHFHFTAWPDHGVPDTTESLTSFVQLFRSHVNTSNKGGPIVVHCSAGVGRTGTFISLDHLLQDIDKNQGIDIYGIVCDMRMSRVFMVQTEMQYIFIHKCILKVLDEKEETVNGVIYSNEGIYENNVVSNFHMSRSHQNNNENHTFLPDK